MSWLKTISASLNEKVKQRTLFACQEVVSSMIAEELGDREELAEATHGHPKAHTWRSQSQKGGIFHRDS